MHRALELRKQKIDSLVEERDKLVVLSDVKIRYLEKKLEEVTGKLAKAEKTAHFQKQRAETAEARISILNEMVQKYQLKIKEDSFDESIIVDNEEEEDSAVFRDEEARLSLTMRPSVAQQIFFNMGRKVEPMSPGLRQEDRSSLKPDHDKDYSSAEDIDSSDEDSDFDDSDTDRKRSRGEESKKAEQPVPKGAQTLRLKPSFRRQRTHSLIVSSMDDQMELVEGIQRKKSILLDPLDIAGASQNTRKKTVIMNDFGGNHKNDVKFQNLLRTLFNIPKSLLNINTESDAESGDVREKTWKEYIEKVSSFSKKDMLVEVSNIWKLQRKVRKIVRMFTIISAGTTPGDIMENIPLEIHNCVEIDKVILYILDRDTNHTVPISWTTRSTATDVADLEPQFEQLKEICKSGVYFCSTEIRQGYYENFLPISGRNAKLIGILYLVRRTPLTWSEKSILNYISHLCGQQISKLKVLEESERSRKNYENTIGFVKRIAGQMSFKDSCDSLLRMTKTLTKSKNAALLIADYNQKLLRYNGLSTHNGKCIAFGEGIAGKAFETGNTEFVRDCSFIDSEIHADTKQLVCIPIMGLDSRMFGVLELWNPENYTYTDNDIELSEMIASLTALCLQRSQAMEREHASAKRRLVMLRVSRTMMRMEKGKTVLQMISDSLKIADEVLTASRISLFLVDRIKKELWIQLSKDVTGIRIPMNTGIVGNVATEGRTLNIVDAYQDSRFNDSLDKQTGFHTKSILCMPIFAEQDGQVVAVIQVINKKNKDGEIISFDAHDEFILEGFCLEVGMMFGRMKYETQLEKIESDLIHTQKAKKKKEFASAMETYSLLKGYRQQHSTNQSSLASYAVIFKAVGRFRAKLKTLRDDETTEKANESVYDPNIQAIRKTTSRLASQKLPGLDYRPESDIHDVWLCTSQTTVGEAVKMIHSMFFSFNLVSLFRIDKSRLFDFIEIIIHSYRDVPYHNYKHALQVTTKVFHIIEKTRLRVEMRNVDHMSLIVAALAHDVDHPGLNNDYQVGTRSNLALLYNDTSVLENHHAAFLFRIVKENNIFEKLSLKKYFEVRKVIVSSILSTDMRQHFELTKKCQSFANDPKFDFDEMSDRMSICSIVVHSADISAQCSKRDEALRWTKMISDEFQYQALQNRVAGLETPSFMLNLSIESRRMKLQYEFIKYVVDPIWVTLSFVFPQVGALSRQLSDNAKFYEEEEERLKAVEPRKTSTAFRS
eukprot:g3209.t1